MSSVCVCVCVCVCVRVCERQVCSSFWLLAFLALLIVAYYII
jgi:hypothetical protein